MNGILANRIHIFYISNVRHPRGCRIMAITAGFQPADRGSIPLTRSMEKRCAQTRRFLVG